MEIKKWLNYHHLYYFRVIATEGGIARAAVKLRLGQPTLSTQLKQFEDMLGVSLFDRSRRHLELTEAGKLVLSYANDIFKLGDELLDTVSDQHFAHRYQVQIGVIDTVPRHLVYQVVAHGAKSQEALVSVSSGSPDDMFRRLRAHQLDLVISNVSPRGHDSKGFFSRSVGKMDVLVCGSKKYVSLRKGFPKSLNSAPVIMPGLETKLRIDVEDYLKIHDVKADVVAEVQDTGVQKIMASHDAGLIFIARPAAAEYLERKELYEIGVLDGVKEDLWLIAAERKIQNAVAQHLYKTFQVEIKSEIGS